MHHNGTISRRSKMFYIICESLNISICTTSGNMIHHFIYGFGWDHTKIFSKCRSIKFGFQCANKSSAFIVLFKFTLCMVSQLVLHSSNWDPQHTHNINTSIHYSHHLSMYTSEKFCFPS